MPSSVLVALGSNLADPPTQLASAVEALGSELRELRVSRPYWTDPVGPVDQPRFLNAAAVGRTDASPEAVLEFLQRLEALQGRERTTRWGPRTRDLDLLLYDDVVLASDTLVLPHPELHKRRFVLEPACELVPHWRHPVLGRSLADLLAELPQ